MKSLRSARVVLILTVIVGSVATCQAFWSSVQKPTLIPDRELALLRGGYCGCCEKPNACQRVKCAVQQLCPVLDDPCDDPEQGRETTGAACCADKACANNGHNCHTGSGDFKKIKCYRTRNCECKLTPSGARRCNFGSVPTDPTTGQPVKWHCHECSVGVETTSDPAYQPCARGTDIMNSADCF